MKKEQIINGVYRINGLVKKLLDEIWLDLTLVNTDKNYTGVWFIPDEKIKVGDLILMEDETIKKIFR